MSTAPTADPPKAGVTNRFADHLSYGSVFLRSPGEAERAPQLLPYAHYLRLAWTDLPQMSGVLCVDGRPTVYLCEAPRFTPEQKREAQRFVWNQGLVPLLILITPDRVEAHSAVKRPTRRPDAGELLPSDLPSLIRDLGNLAEALEQARFVRSIETGQFFHERADMFPPEEAVDRCLVGNLVHTARRLKSTGWGLARAHALLGRALFVSFLHQRQFIRPHHFPSGCNRLLDILKRRPFSEAKRLLYQKFFPQLKREFNGTMFDAALADEEQHVTEDHLDILADFMSGHEMESGQETLGFWAYDFRVIPVETISAIYQEFMKDEDLGKQRREGAFYTPRHLAETVVHVAIEDRYNDIAKWRVLDPACGSGIFLVAMFNLLAAQWLREHGSKRRQVKVQALLDILQNQIRGVDVNPDACRIAAFSLYLALFEKLQPIDLDEFKERVRDDSFLPPLLWDAKTAGSNPEKPVIIRGDFLKDKLPLEKDHDLIIGNPPWESRGDKQMALHFANRSPDYLRDGGCGCLLLPTTILVNRNGTLDGDWFRNVTVEKMVQLADFRRMLFDSRTHACFILRYRKAPPTLENVIAYETPKLNRFDRRRGVIVVEPDDQKMVPQRDVIEAALQNKLQSLWSRKFWGSPRDEAFLRRLDFYPRLSDTKKKRKWQSGVGFQPYYPGASPGDPKPLAPWRLSDRYLPNYDDFPQVALQESDFKTLKAGLRELVHRGKRIPASTNGLRRLPKPSVFETPMVVFSKGFTRFAFSSYTVLFQDSLRSITGPKPDANLLRLLAAVLGSRLMQYLAFHSGSNNGIGRDQFHLYEGLNLPFPPPDHDLATNDAEAIVNDAAALIRDFEATSKNVAHEERAELVAHAKRQLEPLVDSYYSIRDTEKILIADTLELWQPSIHKSNLDGSIPALAFPEFADRKRYADTLCSELNRFARKQGIRIRAEGMASAQLNLVFVTVIFGDKAAPYAETGRDAELWSALKRVNKAAERENGPFNYLRGFSYCERDSIHILKPATMRNWCRTAALNDADAIFEHHVSPRA